MDSDSPQSVVSPLFKNSIAAEVKKHESHHLQRTFTGKDFMEDESGNGIGVLDVFVHRARDIHNICIYHKQDVYAKFCLTSDPDSTVSTKIINGGGRSPVFNENLRLDVRTADSSLKCEIFMMSRARNYLEDQLLGFALVPLSEVLVKNDKFEKEFTLSSTDLHHSPAGFVLLSLEYAGFTPEVFSIRSVHTKTRPPFDGFEASGTPMFLPDELEKIEFPDPKIANENQMMVSEYMSISCFTLDSECSESFVSSDARHTVTSGTSSGHVESFSFSDDTVYSVEAPKHESPRSNVSIISSASDAPTASKTSNQGRVSSSEGNVVYTGDGESDSSRATSDAISFLNVNMEQEENVVQQEIVEMYMKSMQQFTDSLAKMKLPLDVEDPTDSGKSSFESNQTTTNSKKTGSRVFYGSRAFF